MCICILFLYSFFFFLVSAYHSWVSINTLDFEVQKLTEADWKQSGVISLLLQNWLRFTCTSVHLLNMRPVQRLFKFLNSYICQYFCTRIKNLNSGWNPKCGICVLTCREVCKCCPSDCDGGWCCLLVADIFWGFSWLLLYLGYSRCIWWQVIQDFPA